MGREKGQSSRSTPKLERKFIEKNRRNHLKTLYSHLFSLLPTHLSQMQERMALPDQLEETAKYIKWLEKQVEKSKQRKEELLQKSSRKRGQSSCREGGEQSEEAPLIQVLDTSPGMSVVLVNGLESIAQFHDIIRVIHRQHGLEVANATFQIHGNSTLQVVHEQIGKSEMGMVCERLKQVIKSKGCPGGSEATESESLDSWDYDIGNDNLGFPILEQFLVQCQNPPPSFFWTAGNEYSCAQN